MVVVTKLEKKPCKKEDVGYFLKKISVLFKPLKFTLLYALLTIDMKINHLVLVVVVWSLVLINAYDIERRVVYTNNAWRDRPDRFTIPSSVCSTSSSAHSVECSKKGANYRSNCKCICQTSKSTFGYYENDWKCFENTKVHVHGGGCSIKLSGRQTSGILRVLPMKVPSTTYFLSIPDQNCDLIDDYSYLMCNGTWGQLDGDQFRNTFFIQWDNYGWFLEYSTDRQTNQTTNGQLIRLKFECPWNRPTTTHCALFKVTGRLKCPPSTIPPSSIMFSKQSVPQTSTITEISSSQPSSPPSSWSSSSSSSLSPSPSSTPRLRPPVTLPTPPLSSDKFDHLSKPTTIPDLLRTSAATVTENLINDGKTIILENSTTIVEREKNTRSDDDNSGMIAGAFVGVIGLAIIVLAIIVVMRRKKRNTDSKGTVVAENDVYGRGIDNSLKFNDRSQPSPDEDEYSYAYNNVAPFVKTNKKGPESHFSNDQEPRSSVANHVYGRTEELNQVGPVSHNEAPVYDTMEEAVYAKVDKSKKENPPSSDAPIYNTLEEPEYAKVDKTRKTKLSEYHNEPLYNVLEGPETDEGLSEEPPCYQVLEGPLSESAPVYDVLEGPESDETPVYGALDAQDPHVYGALDRVTAIQGSPAENRGYDDMVYDSVGDVINEQGDIYQELNQSGQRDSDVYQALNYPGKTMQLNELNQTHSIA